MKCLVIDDDPLVGEALSHFASRIEGIRGCDVAPDGYQALNLLSTGGYDVVFLDLEMPELDGVSLLKALPPGLQVVIVSAHTHFGAESYDYNVTDYLVKPVDFARFHRAIEKVRERARPKNGGTPPRGRDLFIKDGTKIVRLELDRVMYVKAESNYVSFVCLDRTVMTLTSLRALEDQLGPEFVRIHRSFLVRKRAISRIDGGYVFVGDQALPVGASYRDQLMERLRLIQ
jgi:DNA-binding LytR/AlgR family response regulator